MNDHKRADYIIRDRVLNLLSDSEIASVSTAESARDLREGEEYVDLEQIEHGVQRALKTRAPMGRLLPRKAVREDTWVEILTLLSRTSRPSLAHCSSIWTREALR
jgi:hypothetical protein